MRNLISKLAFVAVCIVLLEDMRHEKRLIHKMHFSDALRKTWSLKLCEWVLVLEAAQTAKVGVSQPVGSRLSETPET